MITNHFLLATDKNGEQVIEYLPATMLEIFSAMQRKDLAEGRPIYKDGVVYVDMLATARIAKEV